MFPQANYYITGLFVLCIIFLYFPEPDNKVLKTKGLIDRRLSGKELGESFTVLHKLLKFHKMGSAALAGPDIAYLEPDESVMKTFTE
mgnify:CR=1 FL=1